MALYGEGEVDKSYPEAIFAQVTVCRFWAVAPFLDLLLFSPEQG
jgi:hypothetical protein